MTSTYFLGVTFSNASIMSREFVSLTEIGESCSLGRGVQISIYSLSVLAHSSSHTTGSYSYEGRPVTHLLRKRMLSVTEHVGLLLQLRISTP